MREGEGGEGGGLIVDSPAHHRLEALGTRIEASLTRLRGVHPKSGTRSSSEPEPAFSRSRWNVKAIDGFVRIQV